MKKKMLCTFGLHLLTATALLSLFGLTAKAVENDWTALDAGNNFAVWLQPNGDWYEADDATLDPANPQAGSFYGSINELDSVHDYWPFKLFVDYKFCTYGGVELAWDYFSARTITQQDGHTDGDLNMRGPLLSAFVRYPADFNLTPYAGAGFAYYKVEFDDNAYWHEPPGRNELQSMDFNHTWGLFVYGGVAWMFADHWSADLYVRYTKLQDAEGTHWAGSDGSAYNGSPSIPLSNIATALGVRYSF